MKNLILYCSDKAFLLSNDNDDDTSMLSCHSSRFGLFKDGSVMPSHNTRLPSKPYSSGLLTFLHHSHQIV